MMFFKYLFIFSFFSVIGWILELLFRTVTTKKIINPGFMTGCVVPLYGFGAVVMNIICSSLRNSNYKLFIVFILAILFLTILEFIIGIILLKGFHLKLWDYSDRKFNFKGIICPLFSLIWGILALTYYVLVFNWINNYSVEFVSNKYNLFLLGVYSGVFLIDLCISIQLLSRIKIYAKELSEVINVEKLKEDTLKKISKNKFLNAIYPYLPTSRFLKEIRRKEK